MEALQRPHREHVLCKLCLLTRYALVFLPGRTSNTVKCTLCPEFGWMPFDAAQRHEDSSSHVLRLRDIDTLEPLSSPAFLPVRDAALAAPMSSPSLPTASPAFAATVPIDCIDEDPCGSYLSRPVHGPALATDHRLQIYDNWAGALGSQYQEEWLERRSEFLDPARTFPARKREPTPALSPTLESGQHAEFTAFAPQEDSDAVLPDSQCE